MKNNSIPITIITRFIGIFIILSFLTTAIGVRYSFITLNETQILYLFSTSAQVLAAIYGLIITGFIFFRNELSRQVSEDETLADAVDSLKHKYYYLLLFITIFVVLALFLANVTISLVSSKYKSLCTIAIDVGQSAFITSIALISYFIVDVVSPEKIESTSKNLQRKLDPTRTAKTKGSLEEFLKNYNQIESLLSEAGQKYQDIEPGGFEKKFPRRLANTKLTEILFQNEQIDKSLYSQLRELITLRNSIIHGAVPMVSKNIVQVSDEVLQKLKHALENSKK